MVKKVVPFLRVLCIQTLKLKFTVAKTWAKFCLAPPDSKKGIHFFDLLMTLTEISLSSASSAKCIAQKHQSVILGEISSSPPPLVSFLVLCLICCPLPACHLGPPVDKVEPGRNFFQLALTPFTYKVVPLLGSVHSLFWVLLPMWP